LSLHTKIVLFMTASILLIGTLLFWFFEYRLTATTSSLSVLIESFFNAACLRSAGFSTFSIATLRLPTLFLIMLMCFIGSSPGSTGGGIKTTTFALLLATVRAVISGRTVVELKERTIPLEQVLKAMAIFCLSLAWLFCAIFILLVTEEGHDFIQIAFEAFSAFANLGSSAALTHLLSTVGKYIIMALMIIGRIGSMSLLLALKRRHEASDFRYPEERVFLS
jgi:trk system potassium uptake protein